MPEVTVINIKIMRLLGENETMTPGDIIKSLPQYTKKDVKYSIRRLREKGLIKVIPNLLDMRRVFYRLASPDEIKPKSNIKEQELNEFLSIVGSSYVAAASLDLDQMSAAAKA